ncbi:unnamed protein product [Hymenolepis diminuta]|uniref:Uncharacterized protein n=1 Tax=Hymenolepis diminuta TaxID=6216 RepID=A0A564Y5P2_HYMDI|nr:unnamed protein product [Hymenolepis diminuta]VUZ42282.1 unnamed protein product [Hymenolepis diminuta]VUZ48056.1 unnamed protein product [Hymenolepis diminuta]
MINASNQRKSVLLNLFLSQTVSNSVKSGSKNVGEAAPPYHRDLIFFGLTLILVLLDLSEESPILSWWIHIQSGLTS